MFRPRSRVVYLKFALASAFALASLLVFCFSGSPAAIEQTSASASGPSPSYTGALLESNCTACHSSFPANSGPGSVAISGVPANYLPNQQIPITVTTSDPNAVIYGFQMVATNTAGENAGTLTFPPATPQQLQVITGFVNGNQRRYMEHTSFGTTPTQFGSKSWTFTWTAPDHRIGKINFNAAGNAANSDGGTTGDYIYTTQRSSLSGSAIANFDSDTRSDISVFRPSNGTWYALTSGDAGYEVLQYGENGDIAAPGDYDGDGKTDKAVFRPSNGTWYIRNSSGTFIQTQFGAAGDVPVPGDYDGDAKNDLAVFRPSTHTWYILGSTGIYRTVDFGEAADKPAQGDYDADGKTDIAVFRPSTGTWFMITSSNSSYSFMNFGANGDLPVQADYDGDGKTDIAVFRPSNGTWYAITASRGYYTTSFGAAGDKPAPADYDGDGKADIAVFRNGTWFILGTEGPTYSVISFGQTGDIPVASGYIAQ